MDERLKFVAGLLDGEKKMEVLCRRLGVSRKTGYKILARYKSCGLEGLTDRSRRPYRHANRARCKSLRAKSVTHVFGINRIPCVRNGPR